MLPRGRVLGASREGRPVEGWTLGDGELRVSLIAGCHADEPVGPAMLRRLVAYLSGPDGSAWRRHASFFLVPDANPDGAARNAPWTERTVAVGDAAGAEDRGYDLAPYLRGVVRELPGDDVEFGFPRHAEDREARPENRAVAAFLGGAAPLHLHASFHGMAFAPGPWFLIEPTWIDRTAELRRCLRRRVAAMGYRPMDVDRGGEKGFRRIDVGFSTRPDSAAMRRHFESLGDPRTAALFRPSSMELVRSLGGDPFTMVSEMPLFLVEHPTDPEAFQGSAGRRALHQELARRLATGELGGGAADLGVRPMPIRDQMRLQVAFLEGALKLL